MNERGQLRFTRTYEISCGRCGDGEFHAASDLTRAKARVHFESSGWTRTRAKGWICPKCAKEQR